MRNINFPACAYGAVVTPDGTLWQHTLSQGITPVNVQTGAVGALISTRDVDPNLRGTYGVTADADGRIWMSLPGQGAIGYDPATRQMSWINLGRDFGSVNTGYGLTVDVNNHVWAATPTRAFEWSARAFQPNREIANIDITVHNYGAISNFNSVSGIGSDRRGRIWMSTIQAGGSLVRLDPRTDTIATFAGPSGVYTYSDFTGSVRRLLIGTGSHNENYDTQCDPQYGDFRWAGTTPVGSALQFVFRTAMTQDGLDAATPVTLGSIPADTPLDVTARMLAAGVIAGRYARISTSFTTTRGNPPQSPVLQTLALSWRCR